MSEEKIYYMAYKDFDYESHDPVGIFEDLEELKEILKKKYSDLKYIRIYKIKLNELFDESVLDLEEIKDWWK